jgi:Ca-activated chloride channel family protein
MTFASPGTLVALIAVPLAAAAYIAFQRRRVRFAERFARPAMLPNVIDRAPGWRRHAPVALLLLGLATLLVGFARPQATISVKRENATVVLTLDTSRSMGAIDIRPSRLAVAKAAALRFVNELPAKYRVGVVAFSTKAEVVAPATRDRKLVREALTQLQRGGGTALGDGISLALDVGRAVPKERAADGRAAVPPVSVLMFTDGIQEGGEVTAAEALSRARKLKVPVSAAVVGTPYGIVRIPRVGGFTQIIRVPADATEVRVMTKLSGGHFYFGPRTADFTNVYKDLGSRIGTTHKKGEMAYAFAIGAIGLLLFGGALSVGWLRRAP